MQRRDANLPLSNRDSTSDTTNKCNVEGSSDRQTLRIWRNNSEVKSLVISVENCRVRWASTKHLQEVVMLIWLQLICYRNRYIFCYKQDKPNAYIETIKYEISCLSHHNQSCQSINQWLINRVLCVYDTHDTQVNKAK